MEIAGFWVLWTTLLGFSLPCESASGAKQVKNSSSLVTNCRSPLNHHRSRMLSFTSCEYRLRHSSADITKATDCRCGMLEDRRLLICHYLPTVAIAICANSAGTIARNIFAIYTTNRHSDYAANADAGCVPPKPRVLVFEQLVTSELNTFFPFDPYKLPRSGSYIQGVEPSTIGHACWPPNRRRKHASVPPIRACERL